MTSEELRRRFERGGLVLDGATGTELERQGCRSPAPLWSADALLSAPDVVEAIHRDYVAAGADIVVANTFRTNPRTLRAVGLQERGAELNRRAVDLARRAVRGHDVLVAASVGPVEDCYHPERVPAEGVLQDEHAEMAAWLGAAGLDLIWIETMGMVREARAAASAAVDAGLPFAVSFVIQENGNLLGGEHLEDAVAAMEILNPLAVGLNCIPPRGLTLILPRLRQVTSRPLAAYAHINNPVPLRGWSFSQRATPSEYASYAQQWLALGVTIVGGCCGTTPAHIAAVRAALRPHENSPKSI